MTDSASPSAPRPRRWLPIVVFIVVVLAAAGGWWRWHAVAANATATNGASSGGRGRAAGGPATVAAVPVKVGDLRLERTAPGTVTALSTVTVRTQIAGRLEHVRFSEGQTVAAGDLLAEIDDRPFTLTMAQYQGQLARDQAQLHQAEADLARYKTLVEQESFPRQQYDAQEALVGQLRGAVASDTAQIDGAKLNIAYCRVTAPAAGRVGLRLVDQGNYVTPGDAGGLVTITQLAPISVVFALPEADLALILPEVDAGHTLTAHLLDRDAGREIASGTLTAHDNAIDAATGTLRMRATLTNEDGRLFPNQFVNVRILIQTRHVAAVLPTAAVQHNARGAYVWRVEEDSVHLVPIRTGVEARDQVEILDGVMEGDRIVIDGLDRLRDGAPVNVAERSSGDGSGKGGWKDGGGKPGERGLRRDGGAAPSTDGQRPTGGKRAAVDDAQSAPPSTSPTPPATKP